MNGSSRLTLLHVAGQNGQRWALHENMLTNVNEWISKSLGKWGASNQSSVELWAFVCSTPLPVRRKASVSSVLRQLRVAVTQVQTISRLASSSFRAQESSHRVRYKSTVNRELQTSFMSAQLRTIWVCEWPEGERDRKVDIANDRLLVSAKQSDLQVDHKELSALSFLLFSLNDVAQSDSQTNK